MVEIAEDTAAAAAAAAAVPDRSRTREEDFNPSATTADEAVDWEETVVVRRSMESIRDRYLVYFNIAKEFFAIERLFALKARMASNFQSASVAPRQAILYAVLISPCSKARCIFKP